MLKSTSFRTSQTALLSSASLGFNLSSFLWPFPFRTFFPAQLEKLIKKVFKRKNKHIKNNFTWIYNTRNEEIYEDTHIQITDHLDEKFWEYTQMGVSNESHQYYLLN